MHFTHITIPGGVARVAESGEVPASAWVGMREISRAGAWPVPGCRGRTVVASRSGGDYVFTLFAETPPGHSCAERKLPLVLCALSTGACGNARLWEDMAAIYRDMAGRSRTARRLPAMPPGPWLAVLALPACLLFPRDAAWLEDFSVFFAHCLIRFDAMKIKPISTVRD